MATINCLVTNILKNIYFFVFSRRKKLIQAWNNMRVSNDSLFEYTMVAAVSAIASTIKL